MARLTAGVLLRNPGTGQVEFLPAESTLPDWAEGLVGDHVLAGDDMPDLDETDPDDPSREALGDGPPPKSGKGSGEAAWRAYAAQHGVDVPAGTDRGDIIAALDAAGVPTE